MAYIHYISPGARRLATYCIAYGTEGLCGEPGGKGGRAGRPGRGSNPGKVSFSVPHQHGIDIVATSGAEGKSGEPGRRGGFGSHGMRGKDNARVRSHQDVPTKWYHGSLDVYYCEERQATSAYCSLYKQEAYIEENVEKVRGKNFIEDKV